MWLNIILLLIALLLLFDTVMAAELVRLNQEASSESKPSRIRYAPFPNKNESFTIQVGEFKGSRFQVLSVVVISIVF